MRKRELAELALALYTAYHELRQVQLQDERLAPEVVEVEGRLVKRCPDYYADAQHLCVNRRMYLKKSGDG